MCVWVGRACSTWSVRRQEPPAVGAHCAPAVGSFMSLCICSSRERRRTREKAPPSNQPLLVQRFICGS